MRAKFFSLCCHSPFKACLWRAVSNITDQQANERAFMPAKPPGSLDFKGLKVPGTADR